MHEHQLLELLLTYAIPRRDVNPLAHELISTFGSLSKVLKADPRDLAKVAGIGPYSSVLLSLVGKLNLASDTRSGAARLSTSLNAMEFCRKLLADEKYEEFRIICLDVNERVLHVDKIAHGTVTEVRVYPRLVAECALRHGAHSVILCHNHPSGSPSPSRDDVKTTQAIALALRPLGITLLDHIIVGGDGEYSMLRSSELIAGEGAQSELKAAERRSRLEELLWD